ncbi:hypothetical protein PV383_43995 [Streptomyces caniscabiei]|uniref:Uncharacterized protein n=1 Tax=Streptomyces caniscabiei TaxID=2746961 RepID=A0ABU4N431_9ACTN|nr:hypothetical protein [Streptomyces caniscabiei]MDX2948868.1 hypothetical protein [Streptomyces caniscabiei]MDX3044077.1 hypothetical protein [Streptomyces caniscabiei]
MEDRTGNTPNRSTHPTAYGTPEADLLVFAGGYGKSVAAILNTLSDGAHVIAAGTVHEIREHGSIDSPRATLQLINDFGQAAYAAADTDVLAEYSLFLMDGVEVSLHGIARQPFAEDPKTTYIQIVRVEPLIS